MAPQFQSFTTSTYTGAAATSHVVTVNKPSGVSDGDLLYLAIATRQDDGVSRAFSTDLDFGTTYPWTKIRSSQNWNGTAVSRINLWARYIVSAASEPASYSFTINYSAAFAVISATMTTRFSGCGPLVYRNTDSDTLDSGSRNVVFPTVTTTLPDTLLVFAVDARATETTLTFGSATFIGLATTTLTASTAIGMGYLAQAAIGTSIAETATWNAATTIANGHTMALQSDLVAPVAWTRA